MIRKSVIVNVDKIVSDLGIQTTNNWMNLLKNLPEFQLGVIKASGKLLSEETLPQLAAELSYLGKNDIFLPLVVGAGPQYDSLVKDSVKVNGLRITSKELMDKIVPAAQYLQNLVAKELAELGVNSEIISFENIKAQKRAPEIIEKLSENKLEKQLVDLGYVGDITNINTKPIISAIKNKKIPILASVGYGEQNYYNINATTISTELAKYLSARKLIVVGDKPVLNQDGKLIPTIYSWQYFKNLCSQGVISGGMITNVENAYKSLHELGRDHSVQITYLKKDENGNIISTGLLEELIGDGSGTKIMLPSIITSYPLEAITIPKLQQSINDIFKNRGMILKDGYFDVIKEKNPTIYFDAQFKGGAISYDIDGTEYMCKIFTHKDYEGLGIATSIMETIFEQNPKMAWRSAKGNECANRKYMAFAEEHGGVMMSMPNYNVFMIGVSSERLEETAKSIDSIPKSFDKIS